MKKYASLLLSSVLFLSLCVVPTFAAGLSGFEKKLDYKEGQFVDVPATSTWAANVQTVYQFGIMNGKTDSKFQPADNVTVGQAIIMACRLHNTYYANEATFEGGGIRGYEEYALEQGIITKGYKNYSSSVSRADFAMILGASLPNAVLPAINVVEDGAIPDVKEGSNYYGAVYRLYRAGVLTGNDSKGTFEPFSNITRGAAAAIVSRMVNESLRKTITLDIKESEQNAETEIVKQGQTLDKELSKMGLSLTKLCDGVWVDKGTRNSNTFVYEFQPDGAVLISSPAFSDDEFWTGSYSVKDGVITLSGEFSEDQMSYNAKKNILVSTTKVCYVEMPEDDEYGNVFPGKEAVLIFQPYDRNPYHWKEDGKAQLRSIVPTEFKEANIKQTVRPYLEALSSIDYPHKICDINYDDVILGEHKVPYYRVTNYSNVQQIMAVVRPYVTAEYLNTYFPSSCFQSYRGKLYLLEPEMGIDGRDANSVTYGGFIGNNEIAIHVDEYGSGDNYCGTRTIYLQESGNGYVVSGLSWNCTNKGYPEYDYTPPGYDPV